MVAEFNPQIVALAKAIRQRESGDKAIPGHTGEIKSRYQWLPGTWRQFAGVYLHNPKAPVTLQNENYVAYKRIEHLRQKGYNPMQIASIWNSGNPDPNRIKSTLAYSRDVYKLYEKYKK